jgi:tetratricopeptide (TPR) repeat protein
VQYYWQARGYWTEGSTYFEQLLALPGGDEPTSAYAVALLSAGRLATLQGRYDIAEKHYEPGLPLGRRAEDAWVRWLGPMNIGVHHMTRGELSRAAEMSQEARAVSAAAGDRVDEAMSLGALAMVAWSQADFVNARELAEKSRLLHQQAGEEWSAMNNGWVLGLILCSLKQPSAARMHLEEALALARTHRDPMQTGFALEGLGRAECLEGRLDEAEAHLIDCLDIRQEVGARDTFPDTLDGLAFVAARRSQRERALRLAGAAEALRQRNGQLLVPVRRQLRDSWMLPVHAELGEEAATLAFSNGMRLALDEALALARSRSEAPGTTSTTAVTARPQVSSKLTQREVEVAILLSRGRSHPPDRG